MLVLLHIMGILASYILIVVILEFYIKIPTIYVDEGLTQTPLFLITGCIYLLILIRIKNEKS